jgi:hypothetical protein
MRPRSTLLLALVVAALGAFVWFYEIEGGAERAEKEEAAKHFFPDVDAEDISSIELRTEDGTNVRLEREGDAGWKLVAPLAAPADRFAADGIASTLAELTPEATFDTPEPLASYGLEVEPAVRFRAGDRDLALRLGNTTPVGGNLYATDGEGKRVVTLASWRKNALVKTLKQLRDGRILDFDRAQVKGVTIAGPDGRVVLARVENGWKIAEPVDAKADADAVEGLLSDLQYLRADEFVDAPAADAALGLDEPWLRIELTRESGEPLTLAAGATHEDRRVVRGSAGRTFEVGTSRLESLPRQLGAFRWKQLASFGTDEAAAFELRLAEPGAAEPLVVRGEPDEQEGWRTTPPAAPGKASRIVTELSALRAEEVAADAMGDAELAGLGLAPPRAALLVRGKANEGHADGPVLADVRLGAPQPDGRIPAQRAGEPTVYWLVPAVAEALPTSAAAWRESFAAKEEPKPEEPPSAEAPAEDALPEAPATESPVPEAPAE